MRMKFKIEGLNRHILDEIAEYTSYPRHGEYVHVKNSEMLEICGENAMVSNNIALRIKEICAKIDSQQTIFFENAIQKVAMTISGIIYYGHLHGKKWIIQTGGYTYIINKKHTVGSAIWLASTRHEAKLDEIEEEDYWANNTPSAIEENAIVH